MYRLNKVEILSLRETCEVYRFIIADLIINYLSTRYFMQKRAMLF